MRSDNFLHQRNARGGGDVREPDKTVVRQLLDEDEFPEILVHGHHDAAFARRSFQENPIARVRSPLAGFNDVVPLFPQPVRQAPARASVHEELH